MRKLISFVLMIVLMFGLVSPSLSAVKKKKLKKKRHYRRIARNWPKGGPRPVFPKETKASEPIEVVSSPAVLPPAPAVVAPAAPAGKAGWFAEGGFGGGALLIEAGYGKMKDNVYWSGGAGYAMGSGFSVLVLDPIRATFALKDYSLGLGLNYAMYSAIVSNVPGISGTLPNKNMFGLEVFATKKFDRLIGRLGYSSALGLRASVIYE